MRRFWHAVSLQKGGVCKCLNIVSIAVVRYQFLAKKNRNKSNCLPKWLKILAISSSADDNHLGKLSQIIVQIWCLNWTDQVPKLDRLVVLDMINWRQNRPTCRPTYVHMPSKYDRPTTEVTKRWNKTKNNEHLYTFYLYGMISMSHTDLMQFPPFRRLV